MKKWFTIGFAGIAILGVFLWVAWPPFTSFEAELTGLDFQAERLHHFDRTGLRGQGQQLWIYHTPSNVSQILASKEHALGSYPMWCPLAFDGYSRLLWTDATDDQPIVSLLKRELFRHVEKSTLELSQLSSLDDGLSFAHSIAELSGTKIAAWYRCDGKYCSDYFVYLINFEKNLIIKLSLLT